MSDFIDWTAEVEEITKDGKLSIIYRCGGYPSDPVGITVKIPEDLIVTPVWVREQMEINAEGACVFWEDLDREKVMAPKRRAIQDLVENVRIAGQTDKRRGPPPLEEVNVLDV